MSAITVTHMGLGLKVSVLSRTTSMHSDPLGEKGGIRLTGQAE